MRFRRVRDWMVQDPITVASQATAAEAKALLEAHHIRHLPVMNGERLVGMITDRDIRLASMPRARMESSRSDTLLQIIRVRQIMTPDPTTASPDLSIGEAAQIMLENRYGGLPVIADGHLVGIITQVDLMKALIALLESEEPPDEVDD